MIQLIVFVVVSGSRLTKDEKACQKSLLCSFSMRQPNACFRVFSSFSSLKNEDLHVVKDNEGDG